MNDNSEESQGHCPYHKSTGAPANSGSVGTPTSSKQLENFRRYQDSLAEGKPLRPTSKNVVPIGAGRARREP
jgi:hypothetical protein